MRPFSNAGAKIRKICSNVYHSHLTYSLGRVLLCTGFQQQPQRSNALPAFSGHSGWDRGPQRYQFSGLPSLSAVLVTFPGPAVPNSHPCYQVHTIFSGPPACRGRGCTGLRAPGLPRKIAGRHEATSALAPSPLSLARAGSEVLGPGATLGSAKTAAVSTTIAASVYKKTRQWTIITNYQFYNILRPGNTDLR